MLHFPGKILGLRLCSSLRSLQRWCVYSCIFVTMRSYWGWCLDGMIHSGPLRAFKGFT